MEKMPETHIDTWVERNDFIVPSAVLTLEEVSRAEASLHEDTARDIENYNNSELVAHEEDSDLKINGISEDILVCKSKDDINPNHFAI